MKTENRNNPFEKINYTKKWSNIINHD
jgi:hypothetical protein